MVERGRRTHDTALEFANAALWSKVDLWQLSAVLLDIFVETVLNRANSARPGYLKIFLFTNDVL